MDFDLKISDQSLHIESYLNASLYKCVHKASQKTCLIRLAVPLIVGASALLNIATRVALVLENLIKGTINIVGSPFHPSCSFCRGMKQVVCIAPVHLVLVPFIIVGNAFTSICNLIGLLINPTNHAKILWHKFDPRQAEIEKQANAAAHRQARVERHNIALQNLNTDPNHVDSLVVLATDLVAKDIYLPDPLRAVGYFERAAKLDHEGSMVALSQLYRNGIPNVLQPDPIKAIHWNQLLVTKGNVNAIALSATDHFQGYGTIAVNRPEAMRLFKLAAENGHVISMFLYGINKATALTGITRDLNEAAHWLRQANNYNHKDAKQYLAGLLLKHQELQSYQFESNYLIFGNRDIEGVGLTKAMEAQTAMFGRG